MNATPATPPAAGPAVLDSDAELLRLDSVSVGYGGTPVTHGVDLTVRRGEIVCLLGPNGAGKTTTLLAISGLIPLMRGSVQFQQQDLLKKSPDALTRMGIVHVPEDRSLFGALTVGENLRVASRDPEDIARVLEYFPKLGDILDRKATVLSGGEQQMLALARALALRPALLIVDEMSLGLAPIVVESILPVFRRIVADTGCSVLMVEQHVRLALGIADRAYVMSRGRIVREGTAAQISASLDELRGSYLGVQTES
ncbi:ABC transporter ATP-binding protein [Herbiconiux sp. KACC 21604]|uniref:ABC transporter ATP-binding protein n=1 Tax=unclassified Herbiconiux TaxID=2618217 RepID=UPI001492E6BC|nr:ABC transporter ATP-binding protein [Herbiconiux sp. SALV-R1]QJU55648.1 ABC transporter ATP-binding protein [Herbiconiux sp. SALV-R1]WPO86848.1 ABC transporter ATP-binding protein [Herbiconiux sp. KACC 21604]